MNPPARRRAAAVDTVRPGPQAPAQEQRSSNTAGGGAVGAVATLPASQPLPKALASKDYAAYAAERKQERERKRLEEAAQLRAKKMAAAARKSAGPGASWSPMKAARPLATRPARSSRPAGASTSRGADNQARAALPAASSSSSGWEGSDCATSRHLDTHRSGMTLSAEGAANHAPSNRCSTQAGGQAAAPVGAGAAPIAHTEGSSNGGWSPRKVPPAQRPSAALAPLPAAAIPAPSGATAQVQGRPVPLLQLHKLQEQPQQQQQQSGSKPGSRPYSRAAAVVQPKHLANPAQPPPHLAASLSARLPTGRAAPTRAAAAALAFRGAATARGPERGLPLLPTAAGAVPAQGRAGPPALEYGGSEAEAQRAQQMVGWAALLLQAAAAVAAERVLLGPAARPDSQPPTAAELPLACGQQAARDAAGRAGAARQQAARALAALEQQRQLKLDLAQAAAPASAERQLLEAEAAADLQAQGLVAHWALQAACEAAAQRQLEAQGFDFAQQS